MSLTPLSQQGILLNFMSGKIMWFKNLYLFTFTKPFNVSNEQLQLSLSEHVFTPCGSTETSHTGWIPPFGKYSEQLIHTTNGSTLICMRKEEKLLPPQVINDLVEEKVAALETDQGRSASKKEKEQFKEDITFELLPRAFPRIVDTHAYINADLNIMVVNTATRGKAEDLLALLRKVLGTLPVTSLHGDKSPEDVMTSWLTDSNLDKKFSLGMEAEFVGLGDDAPSAKVKNQDLKGNEIKAHLDADKYVTKLALEWDETLSFVLNNDLSVKRLKFYDVIHEQNDDIDSDDALAKLDADFALMAGELNRFIPELVALFDISLQPVD